MLISTTAAVLLMMIARQAAAFVILISLCIAFPTSREARSSGDGEIVKSASDDNEYRAVTLSNGIRCVVVSDRSTELAAVEIRVGWCCPKLIFYPFILTRSCF